VAAMESTLKGYGFLLRQTNIIVPPNGYVILNNRIKIVGFLHICHAYDLPITDKIGLISIIFLFSNPFLRVSEPRNGAYVVILHRNREKLKVTNPKWQN